MLEVLQEHRKHGGRFERFHRTLKKENLLCEVIVAEEVQQKKYSRILFINI